MTELFKKKEQTIRVDATQEQTIDTEAVFYSHDKGTAKFLFHLFKKDKKKIPINLEEGTSVLICILFQAADEADPLGRHIYQATIEEAENGIVSWLLPDQILGYQGEVQGSIYLELPNQQSLDTAGRFTFTMKRSPIDEEVPKFISYYYDGFDGLEERLQATLTKVEHIEASLAENAATLAQASEILPQVAGLKEQLTTVENQTAAAQNKATEIQESLSDTKLVATAEKNGLMPAGDKEKLDGIEVGAQKNPGVVSWDKDGLMGSLDKIDLDNLKDIGYPTPFKDVNAPMWDFPNCVSMFTIDSIVAEELDINPTSLTYPNHKACSQVVTFNSGYQCTQWNIPSDVTKDPIWIRSNLIPESDPDHQNWTDWVKLNEVDNNPGVATDALVAKKEQISNQDWDTIKEPGMYAVLKASGLHRPAGAFDGNLLVQQAGDMESLTQFFIGDAQINTRRFDGTTWLDWQTVSLMPQQSFPMWTGASSLGKAQIITLPKPLSKCHNGIILQWQEISLEGVVQDTQFNFTHIPKQHLTNTSRGTCCHVGGYGNQPVYAKYVYISETSIMGNAANEPVSVAVGTGVKKHVLTKIWEY